LANKFGSYLKLYRQFSSRFYCFEVCFKFHARHNSKCYRLSSIAFVNLRFAITKRK
jgi:hypothetical protein